MAHASIQDRCLRRILIWAGVVTCCVAGAISQAATSPEAGDKIDRLIEVSGIAYAARQMPPSIASGFDNPQSGLPVEIRGALSEAAILAFRPDFMIAKVRAALTAALNARQIDETLAWFDSPLGRRITDLENAASEPAANDRILAYAKTLKERPPTKQRASLIAQINDVTQSGEINAMIYENTYLAIALGINAAQSPEDRKSMDAVRQQAQSTAPELRKESDENLAMTMLYSYQPLSDKELASYLKFLKSSGGAAYSKGSAAGTREAMLEQMGRFMQAIPKAIANQKGRVST